MFAIVMSIIRDIWCLSEFLLKHPIIKLEWTRDFYWTLLNVRRWFDTRQFNKLKIKGKKKIKAILKRIIQRQLKNEENKIQKNNNSVIIPLRRMTVLLFFKIYSQEWGKKGKKKKLQVK